MTKNLFKVFFALSFTFISVCYSIIIPTSTLADFEKQVGEYDQDTLIIFDVDLTLMTPVDPLLRSKGLDYIKAFLQAKHPEMLTTERAKYDKLFTLCLKERKIQPTEEFLPELISRLQVKGIKVIALTAMYWGNIGIFSAIEDWRIEELNGLGYDFSNSYALPAAILAVPESAYSPLYKEGIIFTGKVPKGIALKTFIEHSGWRPKKVIFIDDTLKFVESVENEMAACGIETVSLHYLAAEYTPGEFSEEIAELQLNTILNDEVYIPHHEALDLLRKE